MGLFSALFGGTSSGSYRIGDFVRIILTGEEGVIINSHGSLYTVETNETGRVDDYDESELEKLF